MNEPELNREARKAALLTYDALLPADMAQRAEDVGSKKAAVDKLSVFILALLAGAFIAIGAIFCTTLVAGASAMPYGVGRLLAGLAFSLGLVLVVVGGAELFTGNTLIVMAWASRRVSTTALLENWLLVYLGNFIGSVMTAGLMYATRQFEFGSGVVGATALTIAAHKCSLGFLEAVALGIMCNALVCMAVWMAFSARSTTDRILCVIGPITCFIAAGFEHSIANMYFIPLALFIKSSADASFWASIEKAPTDFPSITWEHFFVGNLLPVTIGNLIGGAILVGAVYWFVYLRKRQG